MPVAATLSRVRPFYEAVPARTERHKERPMATLVSILITFLVIALILWLVQRLPMEGRIKQILQIIVIIIGIVALLRYLAVF
jgi:hypothetical protein